MLKNEELLCEEWARHYISEGATHIYVIDHNSSDDTANKLGKFNRVSVVKDGSPKAVGIQETLLNSHFLTTASQSQGWCFVCDIDEFAFAVSGSLRQWLSTVPPHVEKIFLPWRLFGSNGHVKHPEGTVVENFVMRQQNWTYSANPTGHGKTITRCKSLAHLGVHMSATVLPSPIYIPDMTVFDQSSNTILRIDHSPQPVLLNHYKLLSEEYFRDIKSQRGGGQSGFVYSYTLDYFNSLDQTANEVMDTLLLSKRQRNSPQLQIIESARHAS